MRVKLGGREYELKYTVNAIRALIKETGKTPAEILQNGFDPTDFELGVKLIWGALLHANPKLKPDTVGDWLEMSEGVYSEAVTAAATALMAAFQKQFGVEAGVDEEAEEDAKN